MCTCYLRNQCELPWFKSKLRFSGRVWRNTDSPSELEVLSFKVSRLTKHIQWDAGGGWGWEQRVVRKFYFDFLTSQSCTLRCLALYKELEDTLSRPAASLTRPVYEANSRIHQQIDDYIFLFPSHIHLET